MKLFINFLVNPTNILDNWYEAITEQVKNLIEDFRSTDMAPFDPFTWDEEQPILVMEQEDTRARFIRSPKKNQPLVQVFRLKNYIKEHFFEGF